jgi:hypothetical protein
MKNLIIILCFISSALSAQDEKYGAGSVPFVDGKVIFTEMVNIENTKAEDIYLNAKIAFTEMFLTPDAIQLDDRINNIIIIKGNRTEDSKTQSFTLKFQSKDSRYKIDMYDCIYTVILPNLPSKTRYAEELTDEICLNKKGICKKWDEGASRRFLIDTKEIIFDNLSAQIKKSLKTAEESW